MLACYDLNLDIVLAWDTSPYGVGAVLSHKWPNSMERPLAFVSRSLNDTEKKYAQIDRQALAFVFEVEEFHKYIFGQPFTLLTDHNLCWGCFRKEEHANQRQYGRRDCLGHRTPRHITSDSSSSETPEGKDPYLAVLRELIMSRWPQALEKTEYANQNQFKSYWQRRHELSVHDGCVMWSHRVIIPSKARPRMLEVLHEGHPGISY